MIRIDPLLLWMLTEELNCSAIQIAANFNTYYKRCIECPPNITRTANGCNLSVKCWVLRGFYPNTDIVFKLTVIKHEHDNGYFTKVSLPSPKMQSHMRVFTEQQIKGELDNILLDGIHQEKKLIAPRCMTPKGMEPLKRSKK